MSFTDDSLVSQKGIVWMLVYFVALSLFLGYSLITVWPSTPLVVSSLQPYEAPAGANPTVKISGAGFATGVKVSFDEFNAPVLKVESTFVLVELPTQHGEGKSLVVVRNPAGQAVAMPDGFTFTKPLASQTTTSGSSSPAKDFSVTGISPPSGTPIGGTAVTITGAGFADPMQVSIGGVALAAPKDFKVTDSTHLSATTPPHSAGAVDIEVSKAPDRKDVLPKGFTYFEATPPSAWPDEYKSPDGSNLGSVWLFGTEHFISWNVRVLLIVLIVGAFGSLIHLFRSFYWYVGNRTLKNSWLLMYILVPFNGAGLALLFYLIIRGGISTSVPTNPSSLDGYAAIAALVGMFSQEALAKLKQVAGAFFATAEQGKDPAIATTLTKVDPNSGPISGGTSVTITGTGFGAGTQVTFGGHAATAVTVTSHTHLTATTPAHAVGAVDVDVSNGSGQKATLPKGFTFVDAVASAVSVTNIDVASGPVSGGTSVTITGTGFGAGTQVDFGGTPATAVNAASATQLTATTPAHAAGPVDVEVTIASGQKASLTKGFTFVDAVANTVSVTAIDVVSGPAAGGTTVTITGTGFGNSTQVDFGGTPATSVNAASATQLTAVTPTHDKGTVDVDVSNGTGQKASLSRSFEFV